MGDICTALLVILEDLHWLGVAVFLVFSGTILMCSFY